jgi:hypothetical protein|tara:strand:- start:279 stop:473 length:195 start_codon:yes stop_codon:yes gene_type:complete
LKIKYNTSSISLNKQFKLFVLSILSVKINKGILSINSNNNELKFTDQEITTIYLFVIDPQAILK